MSYRTGPRLRGIKQQYSSTYTQTAPTLAAVTVTVTGTVACTVIASEVEAYRNPTIII